MTSAARLRANRRNAKKSTGPRSAAGKARIAQNALRHGLAVPVTADPDSVGAAQRLAARLAGPDGGPLRHAAAQQIALAQLDLLRVRHARRRLLADPSARVEPPSPAATLRACRLILDCAELADGARVREKLLDELERSIDVMLTASRGAPRDPPPLAQRLDIVAVKLARLDRYERRALSRRTTAIRAFDALAPQE